MPTDVHARPAPRQAAVLVAVVGAAAGALALLPPPLALMAVAFGALAVLVARRPVRALAPTMVAVTVVAALAGPNLAAPGAPEAFAFRILVVLLGLGALAYALVGGALPRLGALGRPFTLIGLWVLWSALSIGWADDTAAAVRWSLFLAMMGALVAAIALTGREAARLRRLLWVLALAGGVAVAVGILEVALGIRLPTSALLGRDPDIAFAATSVFGNQNNFATFLTLALPYLVVLPVVFDDARLRTLGIVGAVAVLGALLYTGSKSNLIALGLIVVGMVVLTLADRRRRGRAVPAVAVVLLATALVVPSISGSGLVPLPERALQKLDFTILADQIAAGAGSGAVRSSLSTEGLDLLAETGGLGVGAGNAEAAIRAHADLPVANLHNWWLEVLVNGGLVGFACWLGLFLLLLRGCLRAGRRGRERLTRYVGLAAALSLVGFVAGALGPSTAIHFTPMWISVGLAAAAVALHAAERRAAA